MTYQEEIINQQAIIASLRNQLKNIKFPARTVNWQHQNIGGTRNAVQQRLVYKKQKLKLGSQITASENKIISLRELIFG